MRRGIVGVELHDHANVVGGEARLRPSVVRIAAQRLREQALSPPQRLLARACGGPNFSPALEDQLMNVGFDGSAFAFKLGDLNLQLAGETFDDLVLDGVAIGTGAVVAMRPNL